MKRINLGLLTLMMVALTFGGCTKEKYVSFHARFQKYTQQEGSKIYLNGNTPTWNDGDEIRVNDQTATVASNGDISGVTEDVNGYGIFYPATWVTSLNVNGGSIAIPAYQKYTESNGNQVLLSPMATQARVSGGVVMKNVCGLICVHVTNTTGSAIRVSKIVLEADNIHLWGNFSLSLGDGTASLSYSNGGGQTLTLDCNDAPTISNESNKDFYIAVPAYQTSVNNKFRVKVFAKSVGYEYLPFNKEQNGTGYYLNANEIGTVPAAINALGGKTGAMIGEFSVSSTKKVQFSSGNLRYNSNTNGWSFAPKQNAWIDASTQPSSGLIDLFGWATANNPTNVSEDNNDYPTVTSILGMDDYDWCMKANETYINHSWTLLSQTEWDYLLNGRLTTSLRFVTAQVEGRKGIILFPDVYVHPTSVTALNYQNELNHWSDNNFDDGAFTSMQSAGAIFLPLSGYRKAGLVYSQNQLAKFWTGTVNQILQIDNTHCGSDGAQRYVGCSVRPVTVVQ